MLLLGEKKILFVGSEGLFLFVVFFFFGGGIIMCFWIL